MVLDTILQIFHRQVISDLVCTGVLLAASISRTTWSRGGHTTSDVLRMCPCPHSVTIQRYLTELLHPHGSTGEISTWDATVGDKILRPFQLSSQERTTRTFKSPVSASWPRGYCNADNGDSPLLCHCCSIQRGWWDLGQVRNTLIIAEGSQWPASSPCIDMLL